MRKKHVFSKRLLTGLLTAVMALQLSLMPVMAQNGSVAQESQAEQQELIPGIPWYDTNILGNLPGEVPMPTEDFNAAVNYEWLAAQTGIPTGYTKYGVREEMGETNRKNLIAILEQDTHSNANERMASTIYRAALDMEARNQAGMIPILPYINRIREIKTIDELTAYLTNGEFHLESPFIGYAVLSNPKDTSQYMKVMMAELGVGTGVDTFYDDRMAQAGIPEAEADTYIREADKILEAVKQAIAGYASQATNRAEMMMEMYRPFTIEELRREFPAFPFASILESQGYGQGVILSVPVVEDFKALDQCYRNEHLEGLKGILIEKIFDSASGFLDEENIGYYEAVNGELSSDPKSRALSLTEALIAEPLGKIYVDHFITQEIRDDVTTMVANIKQAFIERVDASEWLTEITRAYAMDKIRNIDVRVAGPDVWRDYSGLSLPAADSGAVFADYAIAVRKYTEELEQKEITAPVNSGYWPRGTSPLYNVWAAYTPFENAINIPAGIISGVFYRPDGTIEERYCSLGTVLGHELTHSLDPNGSLFDKTGAVNDWWTPEDRAAYQARQKQVEEYYGSIMIKPGEYVDGLFTIGESVADMGGLSLLLDVLKKEDNIDYQKAFRAYAQLWAEVETSEVASELLVNDEHPPKYVRVNAVVQQFQEFYDAFGVKEGDAMYLAPENRVGIWR